MDCFSKFLLGFLETGVLCFLYFYFLFFILEDVDLLGFDLFGKWTVPVKFC